MILVLLAACGSDEDATDVGSIDDAPADLGRLELIAAEVDAWRASATLDEARGHAEAAANMVVGPGGLGYGDRDGDGTVDGDVAEGLLPGPLGDPIGLVLATTGDAECVRADVLGGDWADPAARWALLSNAIGEWASDNNTFPSLPAHPMRIVGWATLTQSGTFGEAIEYAGHADLHVDISRRSLVLC